MYNVIKPKEDEMLISYLIRFANVNGLEPIRFINKIKERENESGIGIIDDKIPLIKIKKVLFNNLSLIELFRKFTLNDALAPFYVDYKQFTILYSATQQQYGFNHFESSVKNKAILTKPKICPECCKNGLVLYRHHNLPGVNICIEHKIPLSEYFMDGNSYDKKRMLSMDSYKPIKIENLENELALAKFSKDFMNCAFDINKNDMYMFIYDNIDPDLVTSGRRIRDGFEFEKGIKKIFEQYKTIDDLSETLKLYYEDPKQKDYYEKKGYKLLSEPRNNIVELEHIKCGTKFLTNSWALGVGFGCPVCSQKQTKDETIKNAIYLQSNQTFSYVDNSFDSNGVIDIVHTCGKHKKIRFADYLGYTPVCECEEHANADKVKVQRRLKALSQDDFIVKSHPDKKKVITICKKCGRTQVIERHAFKKNRRCKYCAKENELKINLDKKVKGLFEVLEYPTYENLKVKLKCLSCGYIFTSDYLYRSRSCAKEKKHNYGKYKCQNCIDNQPSFKDKYASGRIFDAVWKKYQYNEFTEADLKKITVELFVQDKIKKIPNGSIASILLPRNAIIGSRYINPRKKVYKINEEFIKHYKV